MARCIFNKKHPDLKRMNDIDRLIELVKPFVSGSACEQESGACELTNCRSCNARNLADHLLENGVIVLPCRKGKELGGMRMGRLNFGKRMYGTRQFRWFYCPFSKGSWQRQEFVFFWWIGYKWYVALRRRGK